MCYDSSNSENAPQSAFGAAGYLANFRIASFGRSFFLCSRTSGGTGARLIEIVRVIANEKWGL